MTLSLAGKNSAAKVDNSAARNPELGIHARIGQRACGLKVDRCGM
jgi:hypothetical protein